MVRAVAAAAGVVVTLLVAGCGGGSASSASSGVTTTSTPPTTTSALGTSTTEALATSTTSAPQTTTTASAQPPDAATLSSQLLTLSDLPTGWSVVPSSGESTGPTACNVKSYQPIETARAEADFQDGASGVPAVSETLASFTTALAATTYSATVTTVNACKTFSLPINGTTYPGTVSALSLGQTFGDQSAAWQFAIASQGLNLIIDQTVVHIGDEIMLFTYLASTPPAVTTITGLLTTAVAGVTGGASTQ